MVICFANFTFVKLTLFLNVIGVLNLRMNKRFDENKEKRNEIKLI